MMAGEKYTSDKLLEPDRVEKSLIGLGQPSWVFTVSRRRLAPSEPEFGTVYMHIRFEKASESPFYVIPYLMSLRQPTDKKSYVRFVHAYYYYLGTPKLPTHFCRWPIWELKSEMANQNRKYSLGIPSQINHTTYRSFNHTYLRLQYSEVSTRTQPRTSGKS